MERIPTMTVAAPLSKEELAAVDYIAKLLDPVKPKRSQALRHLVRLGYRAQQEGKGRP